jgi:hypothetical protein
MQAERVTQLAVGVMGGVLTLALVATIRVRLAADDEAVRESAQIAEQKAQSDRELAARRQAMPDIRMPSDPVMPDPLPIAPPDIAPSDPQAVLDRNLEALKQPQGMQGTDNDLRLRNENLNRELGEEKRAREYKALMTSAIELVEAGHKVEARVRVEEALKLKLSESAMKEAKENLRMDALKEVLAEIENAIPESPDRR